MATILIWFVIWILYQPQCLAVCRQEKINDFVWESTFSTQDEKTSNPLCLDRNHLPVTRKCVNNIWIPSMENTKCEYKQDMDWKATFCPPKYNRIPNTTLCILFSDPQKWSDLCLQSTEADPSNFQYNLDVQKIIREHGDERYWLPIRRKHRLDHAKYKIVTRYNVKFDESIILKPINGDCLTYSSYEYKFHLSNCDNLYSMLCLIDVDEFFQFSKYQCSQGSYTTFNPRYHNRCYRMDRFNASQPTRHPLIIKNEEAQFLAESFAMTGSDLSKMHIQVDIMPGNSSTNLYTSVRNFNRTNWINYNYQIRFTNWDSNFRHSRLGNLEPYTTIKNGKWQLVFDNQSIYHAIHVEQIGSIIDPVFETFEFNKTTCKIQVNMVNRMFNFFMDYCYLNENLVHDINISSLMNGATIELGIGRKNFRCEGFTMQTLKLIKSPTIEVWSTKTLEYEIFVVIVHKSCTNCDFIHESRLLEDKIMSLNPLKSLQNQDRIIQFRKIIDIDTRSRLTKYSLHLLVKKSSLSIKSLFAMLPQLLLEVPHNIIDLRHIDTCLGRSGKYFNFPDVIIGEESTNEDCGENGVHPTLKCTGDSDVGAYWENEIDLNRLKCDYGQILKEVHQNIAKSNPIDVIDILESTTQTRNTIESLVYSNKIIYKLLNNSESTSLFDLEPEKLVTERPFAKLVKTYDNALQTSDCLVSDSQVTENVTSSFLNNYKKMIEEFLKSKAAEINLRMSRDGTYLIQERNIILLVINPFLSPVTGMSIHKARLRRREKNFIGFLVKRHHDNKTIKDIIDRRLEAGINLDYHIINKLKQLYRNFRIVLTVFYKDSWFMDMSRVKSKSKIIGVFIPEYPDEELPEGISTILKTTRNRQNTDVDGCSNWQVGTQERGWNKNFHGYTKLEGKLVSCPIKRTSFSGYVQLIGNDKLVDCDVKTHAVIIKWITIIMSTLSVISVVLIFVAALTIPVFEANETTPLILIQTFANGLQIFVYILFVEFKLCNADGNEMIEEFCLATGAALHYLTLVGFFLSLFATDHLIRAYVIGSNQLIPTTFKIKVILFGWMLPIVIVSICVVYDVQFDTELYLPIDVFNDHSSICYPVDELLLFSIHIPIGIIVILHLIIFVWVVIKTNRNPEAVITKVSHVKAKCQTYLFIFSILSITWLFAVIVYYVENCWVHLIFSYLFAITAPSQGFQIFLVCVVLNGNVQYYFKRLYRNRKLN